MVMCFTMPKKWELLKQSNFHLSKIKSHMMYWKVHSNAGKSKHWERDVSYKKKGHLRPHNQRTADSPLTAPLRSTGQNTELLFQSVICKISPEILTKDCETLSVIKRLNKERMKKWRSVLKLSFIWAEQAEINRWRWQGKYINKAAGTDGARIRLP